MTQLWLDAHISPSIAQWINNTFTEIEAKSFRSLGFRDSKDKDIFEAAKQVNAIIMSKDVDFHQLLMQFGSPPKNILLTSGNTSNERLRHILPLALSRSLKLLSQGEEMVEISDKV